MELLAHVDHLNVQSACWGINYKRDSNTTTILDIRSLTFREVLSSLLVSYTNPSETSERQELGRRITVFRWLRLH